MALPTGIAVGSQFDAELGVLVGFLIIVFGAIYRGYAYFEKYGPLFISPDGVAIKKLFFYSVGFGLVTVYPFTVFSLFAIEGLNLFAMVIIACLGIPLTGMNFVGAFAIGRFFNK